jgi:hypothetical protein
MTIHSMPTARTVSNAKLQGLHILRCGCHGVPASACPAARAPKQPDERARKAEGQIPPGYDGSEVEIETRLTLREIGCVLVVAGVVLSVIAAVLIRAQGSL